MIETKQKYILSTQLLSNNKVAFLEGGLFSSQSNLFKSFFYIAVIGWLKAGISKRLLLLWTRKQSNKVL